MNHVAMVGLTRTDEAQTLRFEGATAEALADKVASFMAARGYHLESGDRKTAVYGRGSAAAHAMLGPLARREKINVTISAEAETVVVVLARGMSGMGGGLLGRNKMSKEMENVVLGLEQDLLH